MTPLAIFGLGVPELLIILAVVLLLFGGARLAGLGKSTGRALREFKEETKDLKGKDAEDEPRAVDNQQAIAPPQQPVQQPYVQQVPPAAEYQQPPASNIQDPSPEVRRDS